MIFGERKNESGRAAVQNNQNKQNREKSEAGEDDPVRTGVRGAADALRRVRERWGASRLARRLAGDFAWLTACSMLARVGALISVILVARILGRDVYGEFSLIRSTVNGFVVLASFGMGRAATKYVAELLATDKERVGRIIALNYVFSFVASACVATIFWILTPRLYADVVDAPRLIPQARLSAILLILSALVSAQAGVMSGLQAFRGLAIATAASGLGAIPFFVAGARFWGLSGAILGFASGAFLNYLINGAFIWRQLRKAGIRYRFRECWQEREVLWNFCLPSTLTAVTTGLVGTTATMILARQNDGIAQVALFEAARQIQTAILYLPNMATQVILPTLTAQNAARERRRYVKTLKYNALINVAFASTLAVFIALASPWIMSAFGAGFEEGAATLVVLLIGGVIASVCNVCASATTSLGALWTGFFLNAIWGGVFLIGAWNATAAGGGALGVATASSAAYLTYLLCYAGVIKRLTR